MKHSLMIFIALFALVFSALGVATPAAAAQTTTSDLPAATQFLNADGTLNTDADYTGSVDISKYNVTLDPKRGPVFSPVSAFTPGAWKALGSTPLNDSVLALVINGTDVYAGGQFTDAGGNPNADYIAKWDGSAWSALGTTPLNGQVNALVISGTDVYVGGNFTNAGGDVNADYIAKWNGTAWSALGSVSLTNTVFVTNTVSAIAISGTDVYVGGNFTDAGGDSNADSIAKWNGTVWSALGTGLNNVVYAIAISGTDVYAGGFFTNAGGDANADFIAKWNGTTWSALGASLNDGVIAIAISGTDVYAGGNFTDAGGDANADKIAKWNGTAWSALGAGLNSAAIAIAISGTDVYVGGQFTNAGGDANAHGIAKWNGTAWSALGTGMLNGSVDAFAMSGTDVYAGGFFIDAGGDANADFIAVFTPTPAELAKNGGFNAYKTTKIPTDWKALNFSATDGKSTTRKEGKYAVQIAGAAGITKTLAQTLALSGVTGDSFTFSFWVRGASIPAAGLCQGQVILYSGSAKKLTKTIPCGSLSSAFKKKTLTFTSTSAYDKVVIKFTYGKASGTVWFDLASLIR